MDTSPIVLQEKFGTNHNGYIKAMAAMGKSWIRLKQFFFFAVEGDGRCNNGHTLGQFVLPLKHQFVAKILSQHPFGAWDFTMKNGDFMRNGMFFSV